jgi:hypothetical protein
MSRTHSVNHGRITLSDPKLEFETRDIRQRLEKRLEIGFGPVLGATICRNQKDTQGCRLGRIGLRAEAPRKCQDACGE